MTRLRGNWKSHFLSMMYHFLSHHYNGRWPFCHLDRGLNTNTGNIIGRKWQHVATGDFPTDRWKHVHASRLGEELITGDIFENCRATNQMDRAVRRRQLNFVSRFCRVNNRVLQTATCNSAHLKRIWHFSLRPGFWRHWHDLTGSCRSGGFSGLPDVATCHGGDYLICRNSLSTEASRVR